MNFRRGSEREEPEINLIPFIDVLLVIIIFLMLTTTYSRYSGLEINLPTADSAQQEEKPNEINVAITVAGQVLINRVAVESTEISAITDALRRAAGGQTPVIIINADAKATHQSVIDVMQAAQEAGLSQISFATQTSAEAGSTSGKAPAAAPPAAKK